MQGLTNLSGDTLKGAVEALLMVSSESVAATDLAAVLGVDPGDVASALAELAAEYLDCNRGFQLREVAGGWRLFTHPAYHEQVEQYVLSWDTRKLSQAALETLAVIAYHQPVTREGIRAIRGVNSDGVISSLREKGLVREVGREQDRGQAILYGTTQLFLEHFGLRSLRDLPPLEDFAPDEESKRFIRERLSGTSFASTLEDASDDIDEDRDLVNNDFDDDADEEYDELEDILNDEEASFDD
jgi:segregation and condensation protein B